MTTETCQDSLLILACIFGIHLLLYPLAIVCDTTSIAVCTISGTERGLQEDCSHRELTSIPTNLTTANVTVLLLNDNELGEITKSAFLDFYDLVVLNLRQNNITFVHHLAFHSTPKLEHLTLSYNSLPGWPDEALQPLTHLTELYLEHSVEGDVGPLANGFSSLVNLEKLDISMLTFAKLSKSFFSRIRKHNVTYLNLGQSSIKGKIDPGAFRSLKKLICLDMRAMAGFSSFDLQNVLTGLNGSAIKQLYLFGNRDLKELGPSVFSRFTDNSLEEIMLSYSGLKHISDGTFVNLKHLVTLKLDNCFLKHLTSETFNGMDKLHFLDLSFMSFGMISSMSYNFTEHTLPNVKVLNISFNNLDGMGMRCLSGLNSLKQLVAVHITTNVVASCAFCGLFNLEAIKMNYVHVEVMSPFAFKELYKVEFADFTSFSGLTILNSSVFQDMSSLQKLILDQNNFQQISESAFSPLGKTLESLSIASASLSRDYGLFRFLGVLHTLDIGGNNFEITSSTFNKTSSLRKLIMSSNNMVDHIPPVVMSLPNLERLEIDHCNISIISSKKEMDFLQSPQLKGFAGRSNPYNCSCELESFVRWLNGSGQSKIIDDLTMYKCHPMEELVKDYLHQLRNCHPNRHITLITSISSSVVVCLSLLVFLFYRFRRELDFYLWYKFRLPHYRILEEEAENKQKYKYDVFVSCSEEDSEFVLEVLLPMLKKTGEENKPLNFVSNVDFPFERSEIESIDSLVESSRKTLVVLSNKYIENKMRNQEYRTAFEKSREGKNVIVVLIYELLDQRLLDDMPNSLRKIIRERPFNCIDWTSDERCQIIVCAKLIEVLSIPTLIRPTNL